MAKIVDCFRVTFGGLSQLVCIGDGREVFDLTQSVELDKTLGECQLAPSSGAALLALEMYDKKCKGE